MITFVETHTFCSVIFAIVINSKIFHTFARYTELEYDNYR